MGSRQDGRDPPSPREVAHNVKRANEIGLAWSVPRIIAIAAVLGVARRDGETCAKPLFEWATMMLAMDLLRAPLRLWVLARLRVLQRIGMAGDLLEELTPEFQAKLQLILRSRVAGLNRGLSIAALALNAAGVVWLLQAGACTKTAPHLYRLCLALTLMLVIFVGLNVCCTMVYFSLVCVFRFCGRRIIQWNGGVAAHGAGPAKTGLRPEEIAKMSSVIFNPAAHATNSSCAVCLSDFEAGEVCRKLECGHVFHEACVDEW
jgi:hypothetical protein